MPLLHKCGVVVRVHAHNDRHKDRPLTGLSICQRAADAGFTLDLDPVRARSCMLC